MKTRQQLVADQFYQISSLLEQTLTLDVDLLSLNTVILPLLFSTDLHCHIHCHNKPPNSEQETFPKYKSTAVGECPWILWFFCFYHVPYCPEGAGLKEEWIGLLKTQLQQQLEDNIVRLGYYPIWCSDLVNNIWYSFSINRIPRVEWQFSLLHLNFTCKYFISQSHGFGLSWFKDLMMQRKTISTRGHNNWMLRLPPG